MGDPLLRWAGSKKKLLPLLVSATPERRNRYIEPFVGSAVLFMKLMDTRAILGDLNRDLIDTYDVVRMHPRAVWNRASKMNTDPEFYYELRSVGASLSNELDRAARFIYLNRYCFNGVYRTNRQGQFNVSRGKGHLYIPPLERFTEFAKRLGQVDLRCSDFEELVDEAKGGDFLYLDPPYALQGQRDRGEYGCDAFREADEDRMIGALKRASRRGAKILLSYSPSEKVIEGLNGWNVTHLTVARNVAGFAGARRKANEVLISNYDWQKDELKAGTGKTWNRTMIQIEKPATH